MNIIYYIISYILLSMVVLVIMSIMHNLKIERFSDEVFIITFFFWPITAIFYICISLSLWIGYKLSEYIKSILRDIK